MPHSRFAPASMFHRRLLLLGLLVAAGMVAPVYGLFRWTVLRGDEMRKQAEGYLVTWRWLPTSRGRILDRQDRVLAQDRPSFDIAVDYRVITGQWAYAQAARRVRTLPREVRGKLNSEQRRALIERFKPDFDARLESMWADVCRLGNITRDELEDRKNAIKKEVQIKAASARVRRIAKMEEDAAAAGVAPRIKPGELDRPIAEELAAHVILHDVDDRTAFTFLRLTQDIETEGEAPGGGSGGAQEPDLMPGVSVIDTRSRDYPFDAVDVTIDRSDFPGPLRSTTPVKVHVDGVATHVIGWMRHRVYAEDNKDRPRLLPDGSLSRTYYLEGESVGTAGVERYAEDDLRGLRGISTRKLDTNEELKNDPAPGKDIRLTIDIQLQARIQALFAPEVGLAVVQPWHRYNHLDEEPARGVPRMGEILAGAAAVIDIDTGDILALVTSPTFSHATLAQQPESVLNDKTWLPALNRPISQAYAPGSIVKPLVLCGAITEGRYSPGQHIACTGHFYPDKPNFLQCWIWKQFNHATHTERLGHDLDGSDAIMVSCNIFFYEMGRRLGPKGLDDWYTRFGVGREAEPWKLGLDREFRGTLPDPKKASVGDSILMGIGQGKIAWTPLHAADAYATIGRAGVRMVPRIRLDAPVRSTDLHIPPRAIEMALDGLRRAANEELGTTHRIQTDAGDGRGWRYENTFNVLDYPGITIWAKSGTADAAALLADLDGDQKKELVRDGDHAWCVLLAGEHTGGEDRPRFAVAVVVDYGGSGGKVAGPIANQVVHALINEGYLKPSGPRHTDKPLALNP